MNSEFENEIVGQLGELRMTAQKVSDLNSSITKATDELSSAGNIAALNLNQLKEISQETSNALESLIGATNFLAQLRSISEPVIIAITDSINLANVALQDIENRSKALIADATDQLIKSSEIANNKLSNVPVVLDGLDNAGRNLTSQINELAMTISELKNDVSDLNRAKEANKAQSEIGTFNQRFDLAIPAAVIAFCLGAFGFRIGVPEALSWTAATFASILAGLSAKNIFNRLVAALKNANIIN
jgi:predicted  nucleic acid-binding Zn-ribbon protein